MHFKSVQVINKQIRSRELVPGIAIINVKTCVGKLEEMPARISINGGRKIESVF